MTHVAVVTHEAGVSDALAQLLAEATGAAPRRLDDRAVEAAADEGAFARARAVLKGQADVNRIALANRRKKLLIADMDSTMIPVECIDEIADFAGVGEQVAAITEAAMRGELDFEGALRERVGLLKGLPVETLEQVYAERVRLNPGAAALVKTMNALGAMTALVSGGFTFFTARVAEEAGFQVNQANTLLEADGKLTGAPGVPILGRAAKLEALDRLCAEGGYGRADVIAVGDGANDLSMVEAAGLGVAYRAKPALEAGADACLRMSDLSALLHLQGIGDAEIVRG
ncbi:phosphoserine phosphatase SerB [Rhodovulum sp. DZ06]|uniref:phosphoserine phosphatase SerB n=1 Tax=Rhodovulum sp. DZ06 TaxID=3425126 RepID=UPI003D34BFD8